jgi:hypothetical protein
MSLKYYTNIGQEIDDLYTLDDGIEEGKILYKDKMVGEWKVSHDDEVGTYIFKIVDGQEFHDHYCDEDYIIKKTNLK